MKQEINPQDTTRAHAFELWMSSPMPMVQTELDCIVNQYTDKFCNPMVMWGKYRKKWFRTTLTISFQFHHGQMVGAQGAQFFVNLQMEINKL